MIVHIKDFRGSIPALRDNDKLFGDVCLTLAAISQEKLDAEKKQFRFIASDDSIDHDEEIIQAGAFHELRHVYMSNPVLLASHQHRLNNGKSTVAGKTIELQTEKNPVWGIGQIIDTEVGRDHGAAIFSGAQRALSVGFIPKERQRRSADGVLVHTKALLLEISLVSVGANPHALVTDYVAGKLAGYGQRSITDRGHAAEWEAMIAELRSDLDRLTAKVAGGSGSLGPSRRSGLFDGDDEEFARKLSALGAELQKA